MTWDLKLLIFIMTFLIGILTPTHWARIETNSSLNKFPFINIYAYDFVKSLIYGMHFYM